MGLTKNDIKFGILVSIISGWAGLVAEVGLPLTLLALVIGFPCGIVGYRMGGDK